MTVRSAALIGAIWLVTLPGVVAASAQASQPSASVPQTDPEATDEAPADRARVGATATGADALPVSLDRIKRKLAQRPATTTTQTQHGLKLEYYIQVYGVAPRIDLFTDFNLKNGPVPFSGPTHADMLEQMTPQEFRTPPFDISSLLSWILSKQKR
jgi:hypothetical protein